LAASTINLLHEFELIARLCANLPKSRRTILGVGDDCAMIAPSADRQLITIDSMVEDVHFKHAWTTPEALGARALTVNLSDIAAMGGSPTTCVVNLAVRSGLGYQYFERLYAGLRQAASTSRVDVVGGNVTRALQLSITIALIGEASEGVMRRDQARAGDSIYVTGTVGDAALGLQILSGEVRAKGTAREFLIDRYRAPTARLEAGRKLSRLRPVPSAIDLSDGLWQDLGHVLEASGVGAEMAAETIPLSSAYRAVMGDDPRIALTGGDDYELLFCTRTTLSPAALSRRLGVPVTRIGQIVKRRGVRLFQDGRLISDAPLPNGKKRSGARGRSQFAGWDQLRGGER
jgi:thiamine-monophosphate kinase